MRSKGVQKRHCKQLKKFRGKRVKEVKRIQRMGVRYVPRTNVITVDRTEAYRERKHIESLKTDAKRKKRKLKSSEI